MDSQKLKGKMREKSKTYQDVAEAIGVSITTINDKLNGKRKIYVEEAQAISNLLDLSNDERVSIFLN